MLNIKGNMWDKRIDEHEHQILSATAKETVSQAAKVSKENAANTYGNKKRTRTAETSTKQLISLDTLTH